MQSPKLNPVGELSTQYEKKPVIQALVQLVPGGGSLDTLLKHRAEEIRMDRLKSFFDELSTGKIELTEELINKEDFLHSYFSTLRAASYTRQREKIRLLAKLLKSSLRDDLQSSPDEYEELLAVLDAISLREFSVLCDLYKYERNYPKKESENELQNALHYWLKNLADVKTKYGISEDAFPAFMAKLERTGLYLRITGGFMDYKGDIGKTTPLFERLLQFVQDENTEA